MLETVVMHPCFVWASITASLVGGLTTVCYFSKTEKKETDADNDSLNNLLQENAQLKSNLDKTQAIVSSAPEGIWTFDCVTQKILTANAPLCAMLGYLDTDIVGKLPTDFVADRCKPLFAQILSTPNHPELGDYEVDLRTSAGKILHARIRTTDISSKNHDGVKNGILFSFISDITAAKRHSAELHTKANYDLTCKMPNRHMLLAKIEAMIKNKEPFSLLLLDLDNFKLYNDTLGHSTGDRILKLAADKLRTAVGSNGVVGRLGGDEFVIISTGDKTLFAGQAHTYLSTLAQPATIDDIEINIAASGGIATYPENGETTNQLLQRADLAMYSSKKKASGHITLYAPHMEKALKDKLNIGTRIRKALARNEFSLHYQPQVSTITGKITGAEALLRWNTKTSENKIGPDQFIPVFEETGLICTIGKWALEEACRQAATWHWMGIPINISVNISTRQFYDGTLPGLVSTILESTGFDPACLCLEITESLLIDNAERVINQLTALNALGVTFSIDDFGTGYSSMSYLQKLPIKEVKIDKSFVKDLPHNTGHLAIVRSLVGMAKALDMSVIAEGVERQTQVDILREAGVTNAQGYLYGRPLPEAEITTLLKTRTVWR